MRPVLITLLTTLVILSAILGFAQDALLSFAVQFEPRFV